MTVKWSNKIKLTFQLTATKCYKNELLDIFPFVVGRLGVVETTDVGLELMGGFVLVVFIAIEFATTGGFFGGTSIIINQELMTHQKN